MLILLALFACSTDEWIGPGDEAPEPRDIGACLSPADGWTDGRAVDTILEGTLIDVEATEPTDHACAGNAWDSWIGTPNDAQWLTIEDADGLLWHAAISLPKSNVDDLLGLDITIDYALQPESFAPDVGHFILNVDGTWRTWVSRAGEPTDLLLPDDVTAIQGAVQSDVQGDCGDWSHFLTEVSIGEATDTLGVGETSDIDGAEVTVGRHELATGVTNRCLDWFVADVLIGATR